MTDSDGPLRLFDALVRCETELWNAVDTAIRQAGAPPLGSLSALRIIERHVRTARVQEVADELTITVGAASKIVDRLTRDGLTERLPHPTDRRSSLLGLTDAGRSALEVGRASMTATLRDRLETITTAERLEELTRTLETLLRS
ncbi:MarR family transcriptional regulator [Agromyces atrinae]|uniref:MarR family winged helix-turn-helix transcriptional regulator n=1 Tax=Agromyces atrinae TaxID=592376 RepID=UPI001F58A447|nr:MarR family transcriptional regulator [Agromyces atrinae]MCI2958111.1 MarR family transcriptional regulator [Agromyces atrinae]